MKRYGIFLMLLASMCIGAPAVRAQTDEFRDLFLCRNAFADGFYEVAGRACAAFIRHYPRSDRLSEVRLLAGRSHLEQNNLYEAAALLESLLADSGNASAAAQGEIIFWLAETYFKGRDYRRARLMYERAARLDPHAAWQPYAVYGSALCLYQERNFSEAQAAWEAFIARYPEHDLAAEAAYKIGEGLFERQDYPAAVAYLRRYLERFAGADAAARAHCLLAEALLPQGERELAIAHYQQSLKYGPRSALAPYARYGIGWAHMQAGRFPEAIEAWENFREFFFRHELSPTVLLRMSEAYQAMQQPEKALAILSDAEDRPMPLAQRQQVRMRRAALLVETGREAQALALCERLAESVTGETAAELWALKAKIYRMRADDPAALVALQQAQQLSRRPEFKVEMLGQMAQIYERASDHAAAQAVYDVILKEFGQTPQAEEAQYHLAVSLASQGREEAALLAFQHVIATAGSARLRQQAQIQLGLTYEKKADPAAALAEFQQFARMYPESELRPQALYYAATVLFNLGRYAEAIGWYRQVVEAGDTHPLRWRSQYAIGWCLYHQGQEEAAAAQFAQLLRDQPDVPVAADLLMWLGHWHLRRQDADTARTYFERVAAFPHPAEVQAEAFFQIGRCVQMREGAPAAEAHFQEFERRFPQSGLVPLAIQKRAELLADMRQFNAASREFAQLARRFPDGPFPGIAWQYMAKLAEERGDAAAARGYLEQALQHPGTAGSLRPQLQYDVARLWEQSGDTDQAVAHYLHVGYSYPEQRRMAGRAYLRAAEIFERTQQIDAARLLYERIIQEELEPHEAARMRLECLDRDTSQSR